MRQWMICVLIVCATFAVYASVWRFDFVNFDDGDYVYANSHVLQGLNGRTAEWAFSTGDAANYHPLTWISLAADVSVFGLRPGYFHVENVLLHLLNSVLLFSVLKLATGDIWPAAFAACVFALHPTHVESVAWISERKDVLSTFFLLISMLFYLRYAAGGGGWFYAWMLAAFVLSLLAKQMGVTLPALLLLLDFWPLRRAGAGWRRLIAEKIPLLILSISACVATFAAQHSGGSVATVAAIPLETRLLHTPVSYVTYLGETLWPVNLCAFYPYRADWSVMTVGGCALLLLAITVLCIRRRRSPQLLVGWLWFAGMLLPVIGIVQIGGAAVADRYLYLPSVGISIMLAWTVKQWAEQSRIIRGAAMGAGMLALAALGIAAHRQAGYWENTRTLFTRALTTINQGSFAHMQLAKFYLTEHDSVAARNEYEQAARLAPGDFTPEFNLGNLSMADPAEAIGHYQRALKLQPHEARVENNLAIAWIHLGRNDLAAAALRAAIADDPGFADAHLNLAKLMESIRSRSGGSTRPVDQGHK